MKLSDLSAGTTPKTVKLSDLPSETPTPEPTPDKTKGGFWTTGAGKPIADLPGDIAAEFKAGSAMVKEGWRDVSPGKNFSPNKGTAEVVLGGLRAAGSPISGAAKALVGDPARAAIPQNTVYGRMAAQSLEDAAMIFGPEVATGLVGPLSRAASPVRTMMEHGVQLTLGQLEPKIAKRMEEAAKSMPILGSFIRSAEGRTLDSFNVATVNKALEPLGLKIQAKNGREAIQAGQSALNQAYGDVLRQIPAVHQDAAFDAALSNLKSMANELPPGQTDRFAAVLDNRVYKRFGQLKAMDGTAFKQVESELSNISSSAKASADNAERQFGYAVDEVRSALRDALGRQYPMLREKLGDVDHAYSRFADVEQAASRRSTAESRFTPGDLLQSIKRSDKSPRDRQFAAGNRPLQDWAEDAHAVIGNKMPDSGTAERALWDVGGAGAAFLLNPKFAAGIGAGSLPYTEGGQNALNALLRSGAPKSAVSGLGQAVQYGAATTPLSALVQQAGGSQP